MTVVVESHHYGENFGFAAVEGMTVCFLPVELLNEKTATAEEVLYTNDNFDDVTCQHFIIITKVLPFSS
jgi:hypothetical protein